MLPYSSVYLQCILLKRSAVHLHIKTVAGKFAASNLCSKSTAVPSQSVPSNVVSAPLYMYINTDQTEFYFSISTDIYEFGPDLAIYRSKWKGKAVSARRGDPSW